MEKRETGCWGMMWEQGPWQAWVGVLFGLAIGALAACGQKTPVTPPELAAPAPIRDLAIEAEAEAQAICMQTNDFRRAYEAFVKKEKPVFEGN